LVFLRIADLIFMEQKHKYQYIANTIAQQIQSEVLSPGDKLPSLRLLCGQYKVSQSTALAVFYELEAKGYVEARPKSGYFVSRGFKKLRELPSTSKPVGKSGGDTLEGVAQRIFKLAGPDHIQLSHPMPADELLPIAKLNKSMILAMRRLKGSGTAYGETQGNSRLRRQVARHSYHIPTLSDKDIITTDGCVNALSYALMATTRPGDSIVVESPVYFGILRLAHSLQLNIIELPTHPVTGIDPDALKKTLAQKNIKACILVSNFSNPLGSLMPDEHKLTVVKLIQRYNVPLIEDDIYGDIYFGSQRPITCKSLDESGLVLLCDSFSKTLAPGYRVGWIAPGKFKEQVLKLKLCHTISSPDITEEVIAGFLETGRYEHHLRKLRRAVQVNSVQYINGVDQYFPENTKVSKVQGGLVLWVEFDKKVDTLQLFEHAVKAGISIAPGKMFTFREQFGNCIRLNYGKPWDAKVQTAMKTIGSLARMLSR
jgi:DNA-binding transcriptional MocR family regulator